MNLDEPVLTITQFDDRGNIIAIHQGKTTRELYAEHLRGECDFSCGFCYEEACFHEQ